MMPSRLQRLANLSRAAWKRLKQYTERFEDAWQSSRRPALDDYLPADDLDALVELVHIDLEYRLEAGDAVRVEAYLQRFPALAQDRAATLELILRERELRGRAGTTSPAEYLARFPQYSRELRSELDTTPVAAARIPPPLALTRLGKYELLEVVGRGGFGVVFRARDTELDRIVAVKVSQAGGVDTPEAERFLPEARASARLQHPSIVALHDAGQSDGVFYLVSEFIAGTTLAERLAAAPLPPRQAAALLAQTAEAVDYAHRRGIIHRDLKPANILLDADGRPHIMDFGLAKWETGRSRLTAEGVVLGTPAYMPPEQARGEAHQVDARGDVYSLGVILFELLAGEPPFRGNPRMVLRQVLEIEPRSPRTLQDGIPRDLETICLRCLQKEPDRRYGSAQDLADDLERFLHGQPVRARPIGVATRLVRWSRRRPAQAALAAALALVTVLGFAGVLVEWRVADEQRRQAQASFIQAEDQRRQAEENLHQAHLVLHELVEAGRHPQLMRPGLEFVRRNLFATALRYYQHLLEQNGDDPYLQAQAAQCQVAVASLNVNLAAESETAEAERLADYQAALALWRRLVLNYPGRAGFRGELGVTCYRMAKVFQAQNQVEEALKYYQQGREELREALHNNLSEADYQMIVGQEPSLRYRWYLAQGCLRVGDLHRQGNRLGEAQSAYREAFAAHDQLARENPTEPDFLDGLAKSSSRLLQLEQRVGNPEADRELYRHTADFLEERLRALPAATASPPLLAQAWQHVGDLHGTLQQRDKAAAAFQRVAALCQETLRTEPQNTEAQRTLGFAGLSAGYVYRDTGRPDDALTCFRRVRSGLGECAQKGIVGKESLRQLAASCLQIGKLLEKGQPDEAAGAFQQAGELYEQLVCAEPGNASHQHNLGTCFFLLGNVRRDNGHWDEALRAFERAAAIRDRLVQEYPDNLGYRNDAHWSWQCCGEMLERLHQPDAAASAYRQAVGHLRELVRRAPQEETHRRRLDQRRDNLVRLLREMGRPDEAEALLQ